MSYKSWINVLQLQFFSVVLQGVADSESIFSFIDKGAFGKQSLLVVHFLVLLYITSWKTLNLLYQILQGLREVE